MSCFQVSSLDLSQAGKDLHSKQTANENVCGELGDSVQLPNVRLRAPWSGAAGHLGTPGQSGGWSKATMFPAASTPPQSIQVYSGCF